MIRHLLLQSFASELIYRYDIQFLVARTNPFLTPSFAEYNHFEARDHSTGWCSDGGRFYSLQIDGPISWRSIQDGGIVLSPIIYFSLSSCSSTSIFLFLYLSTCTRVLGRTFYSHTRAPHCVHFFLLFFFLSFILSNRGT